MGRKLRLKERNCIIGGWYLTIQFCWWGIIVISMLRFVCVCVCL
jgi:hypothetical protein